jgi:hypothetical protein
MAEEAATGGEGIRPDAFDGKFDEDNSTSAERREGGGGKEERDKREPPLVASA